MTEFCPCGSGRSLADCCALFHDGQLAPDPESLMRSRYSAFALGRTDYLLDTWHSETRPAALSPDAATEWRRLEILASGEDGDRGHVHFRATWQEGDNWGVLAERSVFLRESGRWLYHSGEVENARLRPGRNEACPCGSGRKFKKCCG